MNGEIMHKLYLFLLLVVSLLINNGCSPIVSKYRVTIDAITAPNISNLPKKYMVKALGKNTDEKSLKFQYQVASLDKLLQKEGYQKVKDENLAQQIIFFDYGIEKIFEERESSEPRVTMGISIGHTYGWGRRYSSPFWNEFGYYRSYNRHYIYYNRYVTLLAKEPKGKELWRIDISSVGESKNLKKIIPLLLEASTPYIGKNTKEPVKVIIKEKEAKKE